MKLSIIIATYNYASFIPRAIKSVLDQNDPDYEIIVIDDGSKDNTQEVVEKIAQEYPTIHYLRQENQGVSAARNRGIKIATGDYLLFLDADDTLLPHALKIFREFIASHPDADVIFGGHIAVHSDGKRKKHVLKSLSNNSIENFSRFIRKEYGLYGGASVFNKKIFEKILYPIEVRLNEDILVFAYSLAFFKCYTISDFVLEVYKHKSSLRNNIRNNKDTGLKIVEVIFNPHILPKPFMKYKIEFYSRRCLGLFRTLYLAGNYKEARQFYYRGIKACPKNLLLLPYLKKFLFSFFRT